MNDVSHIHIDSIESNRTLFDRFLSEISRSSKEMAKSLVFLNYEIDYSIESTPQNILQSLSIDNEFLKAPVIKLFGCNATDQSVLLNVHGFWPYLYCKSKGMIKDTNALKQHLKQMSGSDILSVTPIQRHDLLYFNHDGLENFVKITTSDPKNISRIRSVVEGGISIDLNYEKQEYGTTVYEADVPYVLRFLIDTKMSGCSWIEIDKYILRDDDTKNSFCTIEADCHFQDIKNKPLQGEWQKITDFRLASLDIECVALTHSGFPYAKSDPIIQIATVFAKYGIEYRPMKQTVFTLKRCAAIDNANVISFENEKDMLLYWVEMIRCVDPDILIGYNFINFDINYIIERMTVLKVQKNAVLGRLKDQQSKVKESRIASRQMGIHDTKDININGRIKFDVYEVVRREYKLKSYSLNSVASYFLNDQKEHVNYSIMKLLHEGNEITRQRIATYCLKDAQLPLTILCQLLFLYNYVEMSRVTGTPIAFLFTRGQQIKVTSQLLRKAAEMGYIIPTVPKIQTDDNSTYEGGAVLDPVKGFYKNPIATLDFASLYPSIMIAYNLCYTTLVRPVDLTLLSSSDIHKTSQGNYFVKQHVRKGLLPQVVEDLINARKKTKKEMQNCENEFVRNILNGRQLALKISANSVYGYTGATAGGQLPCVEISSAITAYGRDLIETTRDKVEKIYSLSNGYDYDAKVIYGDTDSVMIELNGCDSLEKIMKFGEMAAEQLSNLFPDPIRLEFEKSFYPFLLMNKKRYAGLMYTNVENYDRIECRGIETVRRDVCDLVQQLVDEVLQKILINNDIEGAKDCVKKVVSDLLLQKVDLSLLVLSKSIGKEKYKMKLPHIELWKKLKQRDSEYCPQVGDRIHYIITNGMKGQPQYDRAEDPIYALKHNIGIDTNYYIDCVKNPIIRIFEPILANPSELFSGSHTRVIKMVQSDTGGLKKFTVPRKRCLNCRLMVDQYPLCNQCRQTHHMKIYLEKLKEWNDVQRDYNIVWTHCQRCQGSYFQDIICTSRDCPIFYRRIKSKNEVERKGIDFSKFSVDW